MASKGKGNDAARINDPWKRLTCWFEKNLPAASSILRDGATRHAIADYETAVGRSFPTDVREWFTVHDGQEQVIGYPLVISGVIFGWEALSLARSFAEWKHWSEIFDPVNNEEWGELESNYPADAILPGFWQPGWIPLLRRSGGPDYLGVDLNPGPKGKLGQVINFGRNEGTHVVAAPTWADFIDLVATEYEAGNIARLEMFGDGGFELKGHKQFPMMPYTDYLCLSDVLLKLHQQGQFDGERVYFRHP